MSKKLPKRKRLVRLWVEVGKSLRRNWTRLPAFTIIALFLLLLPGQGYYETLQITPAPKPVRANGFADFQPSLYPQKVGQELPPYLSAQSVDAIDLASMVPLYQLNPNERLHPASITKLMTALVALDYYQLNQVLTVQRLGTPEVGESEMGLAIGDRISVEGLLYGLLVPSGNDAAYTLADNYPGGIENFIYSMNKKAENLHMDDTHFANPSGLDDPNHYTTAHDLALLTVQALKNPLINRIVDTAGITESDATGQKKFELRNVNQFLGYLYGADGVKTGFTDQAGQCLVSSTTRNGHRVIVVLLDSQDRFGDSGRLIEWIFRNFQWINPASN